VDRDEWLRIHKQLQFWGILGWGLTVTGALAMLGVLAVLLTMSGLASFVGGLAAYARHKGLPAAWGLTGLGCILGLIILRFLPKRCRGCERRCAGGAFDCPGCGAPI
jgi:hypothetical protein